jgi:hypothetical protein
VSKEAKAVNCWPAVGGVAVPGILMQT